jgi:hypothetical protein
MSKIPKHKAMKAQRSAAVKLHEFCSWFLGVDNLLNSRLLFSIPKGEVLSLIKNVGEWRSGFRELSG